MKIGYITRCILKICNKKYKKNLFIGEIIILILIVVEKTI